MRIGFNGFGLHAVQFQTLEMGLIFFSKSAGNYGLIML